MAETCDAVANVGTDVDPPESMLLCELPPGHDGPHYDSGDNITWKEGLPDG